MKKKLVLSVMLVVMLALGFISCDNGTTSDNLPPPSFVAVTSISGVQTSSVKNTVVTLTGTVNPADATNKTIAWTVKTAGTTGATITDGNKLNTTDSGTVMVTASITNGLTASSNFEQDFNISITDSFVAVTSISGVPTSGTVGTALTLSGTVNPNNATNQTITWSVKSGSATINGNSLTASVAGEVVVTATIVNGLTSSSNFTQDFNITFTGGGGGFVAVSSITDVPTSGTVGNLMLTGTVNPNNATNQTIVWTVKTTGATGATITGNTLNTTASGTVTVTASIINGLTASSNFEQDFNISITGGGGGGIPTGLIGKWSTSQGGGEQFEITAIYYINSASHAPGTHLITVNGNTITVHTGTTSVVSGTFNFTLSSSDTVLTVTEHVSNFGSSADGPSNGTYYKISAQ